MIINNDGSSWQPPSWGERNKMKWNEQTFYIHPLTNKNSSCAVTHHITTRANQKIKQWSQRYDLCFYIYIYIYFRKQSGQPICLRLSLQLRLWLLRLLVEVLLPFIRLTCVLCLTPLRLKIKKRQDPWKCTTSLIIFWVNHISIIFHIFHQFMEIELPKTKTDSQTQRHANTCHEQEI